MTFFQRIKNLWNLSAYEAGKPQDEYKQAGTEIITLVKKPQNKQKALFIPRIKEDPVKRLIEEQPQ